MGELQRLSMWTGEGVSGKSVREAVRPSGTGRSGPECAGDPEDEGAAPVRLLAPPSPRSCMDARMRTSLYSRMRCW